MINWLKKIKLKLAEKEPEEKKVLEKVEEIAPAKKVTKKK